MNYSQEHPPAYLLENYSVDDVSSEEKKSLEEHIRACSSCQEKLDELSLAKQDLQKRISTRQFAERVADKVVTKQLLFTRPLVLATGLASICLIVFFAVWYAVSERSRPLPETRLMGADGISFVLNLGDETKVVQGQAKVAAQDVLRIRLVQARASYLAVVFIDQYGELSWYLPQTKNKAAVRFEVGEHWLPKSAIFDQSKLDECVFVIQSHTAFDAKQAASMLQKARIENRDTAIGDPSWLPDLKGLTWSCFTRD
jgi:hypothetical protein